jgi:hypothetical protein
LVLLVSAAITFNIKEISVRLPEPLAAPTPSRA